MQGGKEGMKPYQALLSKNLQKKMSMMSNFKSSIKSKKRKMQLMKSTPD